MKRNKYTVKNNSCKTQGDILRQKQKSTASKEENSSEKLGFFYEVWRLADIKHKYIILYMYLYKHIIFFLKPFKMVRKTTQVTWWLHCESKNSLIIAAIYS